VGKMFWRFGLEIFRPEIFKCFAGKSDFSIST